MSPSTRNSITRVASTVVYFFVLFWTIRTISLQDMSRLSLEDGSYQHNSQKVSIDMTAPGLVSSSPLTPSLHIKCIQPLCYPPQYVIHPFMLLKHST